MSDSIMVVDDDPQILRLLGTMLQQQGARVMLESNPRQGLEKLKANPVDVLFTDLRMPGFDGLDLIREARTVLPSLAAVVISGFGSLDSSVSAFRLGAVDFLTKPFSSTQIAGALARASASMTPRPNAKVDFAAPPGQSPVSMAAASAAMKPVVALAARVAAAPVPVLVVGESGVGKEMIARHIHSLSPEATGPFVTVNCQAVGEPQLLDVFFGRESASDNHGNSIEPGVLERASGGMLFLRNVTLLPKWMQAELLHTLQTGRFLRQGGQRPIRYSAHRRIGRSRFERRRAERYAAE